MSEITSSDILEEIALERHRQKEREGWTIEHDDEHTEGELPDAAAVYALCAGERARGWDGPFAAIPELWPWDAAWFKPKDSRRDLIRAAALIVAEIERLDRKSETLKTRNGP